MPSRNVLNEDTGIAGGFAPPTPDAIHTFTLAKDAKQLQVTSAIRPDGSPSLQDALPKTLDAEHDETKALIQELHDILKDLPTEQPPGSEDIYGLDTSIAWGSDDLEWVNGGPQGCGGGTSFVQPTAEQKLKFKRAVEIATELSAKAA